MVNYVVRGKDVVNDGENSVRTDEVGGMRGVTFETYH